MGLVKRKRKPCSQKNRKTKPSRLLPMTPMATSAWQKDPSMETSRTGLNPANPPNHPPAQASKMSSTNPLKLPPKTKAKIVKDVTQLVLARRTRMCNFLEYKGARFSVHAIYYAVLNDRTAPADSKVVYRRYASLFFVCGIGSQDNELVTLEIIHRYVEVLDRYFGNVSRFCLLFP